MSTCRIFLDFANSLPVLLSSLLVFMTCALVFVLNQNKIITYTKVMMC